MGRMEMNCSKALRIISLVIDGEATVSQKRLLDFHLMGCSSCRKAMNMSRDISRISRNLPIPALPINLEADIREILRTGSDIKRSEHRFRSAILALPAAAALLVIAITILPFSPAGESVSENQPIGISMFEPKNDGVQLSSKSGVRTAPFSDYSRQASLISF